MVKRWLLAATAAAVLVSCTNLTTSKSQVVVAADGLLDKTVSFQYAVYLTADKLPGLAEILAFSQARYGGLHLEGGNASAPGSSVVKTVSDAQVSYAPPDRSSLVHFGKGLTSADLDKIGAIHNAIIVSFNLTNTPDYANQALATAYILDLARHYGGYVWDEECRILCAPAYWRDIILPAWKATGPVLKDLMVIHQYQDGELIRSISLGMKKLGLPDLVINGASRHDSQSAGNVINILGQYLAENPQMAIDGRLEIDLQRLRDGEFKQDQVASLLDNGVGRGTVLLEQSPLQEGDADNRLWALRFQDFADEGLNIKQSAFFASFFGSTDGLTLVKHDDQALQQASDRAKTQLPALRQLFNQGMKPGEMIVVKAPFATDNGGTEWMWVEVLQWKDTSISGLLQNQPVYIANLKSGQRVEVDQADLFDYILYHADGTTEGNETGQILETMNQ